MTRGARPSGRHTTLPINHNIPRRTLVLLTAVVAVYVVIGSLYAALTPDWQVPDEPAHYNYIQSLAEGRGFPTLEAGDYDQAYLERLTSEGFPPQLSVEPLAYENHQPPLYYLVATPIYLAFGGALLPLRLLSILLGAGTLIVSFGAVRAVFPAQPELGLMVAAFIAFIPQHVAITAGVNNDVLAELVVAGTLWALIVYLDEPQARPWPIGLLVGTALLTKTTAYVVAGVAAGAVVIRWRREAKTLGWAAEQLALIVAPALLLSAPWFVRNGITYGWDDPLGLARHEAIVQAQPRSSEWLTRYGWGGLIGRLARTTFQSFWGQFGWMAVPLPARIYRILLLFSILLAVGFVVWGIRQLRSRSSNLPAQQTANCLAVARCVLLALSAGLTFSAFIWYNLTFVQHQGRYLFPALIPLATAAALGLETLAEVVSRRLRPWVMIGCAASLAVFDVYCLFRIILPNL